MKEDVLTKLHHLQQDARIVRLRTILFFCALTIELVVELMAKSAYLYPYESYTFRLTFLLTLIVVLLTDYTPPQYVMIAAACAFGLLSYYMCGRNEILRFAVFIIACKGIDTVRAMRYVLYVMTAGMIVLAMLAVTGVFGEAALTANFRGYVETRYTFGMGHPNAFHCMVLMLSMLWLYLHRGRTRLWTYVILLCMQVAVFLFTDSRTSLLVALFALTVFLLAERFGKSRLFLCGAFAVYILSLLFSMWGASLWRERITEDDLAYKLNMIITGRFNGIWVADENAMLWNWLPFSSRANDAYFDMGWVRLTYWYGYIPALIIAILIAVLMIQCYYRKDAAAIAWIVSVSVYTIIEAHLVSVYIGRNYLLLLAGAYAPRLIEDFRHRKENADGGASSY